MFRYLNLENQWPGFQLSNLVNDGGLMRLAAEPGSKDAVDPPMPGLPLDVQGLMGAVQAGIDDAGNVYFSDRDAGRILRWRECDGRVETLPCLDRDSALPGQLSEPGGVLVGPRRVLYVADSGNHRIPILDLDRLQLRGIWGQSDPFAPPAPSAEDGRFDTPSDVAASKDGFVYVAERGNRRIQKFSADGQVIPEFAATLKAQPVVPGEPVGLASILLEDEELLLVLDGSPPQILVYRMDGSFDAAASGRWRSSCTSLPGGVVFMDETCGAATRPRRGLVFDDAGKFAGEIRDEAMTGGGLTLDRKGRLRIQTGRRKPGLLPGQVFSQRGNFLAGPFATGQLPVRWGRVTVALDPLPSNAHLQLFTFTNSENSVTGWPPPVKSSLKPMVTGPGEWRAAPVDAGDFLVLHEPARFLWIGGIVEGNGKVSPAIHQIRLEFDHEGWLRYLPSIYARSDAPGGFLNRSLALFEGVVTGIEREIDDLAIMFDPWAAPDQPPSSWLDWLSTWLAFDLNETWTADERRRALARAFELLGRRGTLRGLAEFIALYTGVDAVIEEPARGAGVWSLPDPAAADNPDETAAQTPLGMLGFTTMLAAAQPQGAVLGTTAILDGSHLISRADYGAPLFEDLAHRFCVRVRASELTAPGAVEALRRVIDREKPAHTTYALCVAQPFMRVGAQSHVGVDTIVGGPLPGWVLDQDLQLGVDAALPPPQQEGTAIDAALLPGAGIRLV